jgi:hypothetical protein
MDKDEITYGGFFVKNVRNWLIKECLSSGQPDSFFRALREQVEFIDDEWSDDPYFWEKAAGMDPRGGAR